MTRLRADMLLLLGALVWGTAFIAQKIANQNMTPLFFIGCRFLLSALVLLPLVIREAKKQIEPIKAKDYMLAGLTGVSLFAGASLQQVGLLTASATNGGFLTALYVVFVPFVVWALTRQRPSFIVGIACMISILGAWLLAGQGHAWVWKKGDVLLVAADIGWAVDIALVPVFLHRVHRPFFLCFAVYGVTAVLGLVLGAIFEPVKLQGVILSAPAILYAGLVSGGIAYTLQIIAQKYTPAPEAALIMSLESVFAAVSGAVFLHERLTLWPLVGCALILTGVALVEAGPILFRVKSNAN